MNAKGSLLRPLCPPVARYPLPLERRSYRRACRECETTEVWVGPSVLIPVALVGALCVSCAWATAETKREKERIGAAFLSFEKARAIVCGGDPYEFILAALRRDVEIATDPAQVAVFEKAAADGAKLADEFREQLEAARR